MWTEQLFAAPASSQSPLIAAVVTGLFGLFGGGALVALLRVNVDRHKIVVQAAQGAVIVQSGVIDDLTDELARVKADGEQCRREVHELRRLVKHLEAEVEGTTT